MRLHRLPYSCYARYVQAAIELAGVPCEIIDVPYGDREQLARLTSGYILVPVLERDDGSVLTDSRAIMVTLLREDARLAGLVPAADAGPIWAYADWANSTLATRLRTRIGAAVPSCA
jgi:glutathione S-transferase